MGDNKTLMITNAPEQADGFGTRTVEYLPFRAKRSGLPYRRVEIGDEHLHWQTMRYASGLWSPMTEEKFQELVQYGLVEPAEVVVHFSGKVIQDEIPTYDGWTEEKSVATFWSISDKGDNRTLDDVLQALRGKCVEVTIKVVGSE